MAWNRGGPIVAEAVTIRGRGDTAMSGVISRPTVIPPRAKAIVILEKTGLGDVWRRLAEGLARRGFVVIRFEPPGIGDSPGGDPSVDVLMEEFFRRVQEGGYTQNLEDVARWVQRVYTPSEMFLVGICASCASVLLATAALGDAVSGAILMTPAVLYVVPRQNMTEHKAQTISRGYVGRLLDPAAYRSFLIGKSDYRVIWTVVRWLLRQPVAAAHRALAKLDRTPRPTHPRFNKHFWEGFRATMDQRTPVLALLAEMDGNTHDFNAEFKARVLDRYPRFAALCPMRVLPRTDHSLLFEEGRQLALDSMLEWFDSLETKEAIRAAAG